eukprot:CAMPEP_0181243332 /NCGR_PEP_ID=MMETSP1096-20121128/42210_1 /TAXON_ID=156174 ORGANISM="Chrysochromulina ericina, Strain CCMP281" /NCGR_SAMPLE_ID=MMETSP1096 /ASSEMBLY_ACC=CAM_ASM_000453 /LENGTH=30 /DNA_ID= /DNA_START= /DNA_END= /DNA_ORIENTATION=
MTGMLKSDVRGHICFRLKRCPKFDPIVAAT